MNNISIKKYPNGKLKKIILLYIDGINPKKYIEEFDENGFTVKIIKHYLDCEEYSVNINNKSVITVLYNNVIYKKRLHKLNWYYDECIFLQYNVSIKLSIIRNELTEYNFDTGEITYYKHNKKYLTVGKVNKYKEKNNRDKIYYDTVGNISKKKCSVGIIKNYCQDKNDNTVISNITFLDNARIFYYLDRIIYYNSNGKQYKQIKRNC